MDEQDVYLAVVVAAVLSGLDAKQATAIGREVLEDYRETEFYPPDDSE